MSRVSLGERSQQFVEAASRVIAREGLSAATTRRIAAEANAPLASLHYCFHSKDALLNEVYRYLSDDYVTALPPLPEDAGLEDTVREHIKRVWARTVSNPWEQLTVFELLLHSIRMHDEKSDGLTPRRDAGMYQAWISSTMQIFREGAHRSGVQVGPEQLAYAAHIAVAGLDGITLQHVSDPDVSKYESLVDQLIHVCIYLLDQQG